MIFSDLPSPAEAGFAKAGNRFPLFGIMRYFAGPRGVGAGTVMRLGYFTMSVHPIGRDGSRVNAAIGKPAVSAAE
jgi:hypothetical protein